MTILLEDHFSGLILMYKLNHSLNKRPVIVEICLWTFTNSDGTKSGVGKRPEVHPMETVDPV